MSFSYEYTIQLRDTDAAGVVYFAHIISICHVTYEASLIAAGIDLKLFVNNSDFAVPIVHVSADFYKPLYCGDRVIIRLTPQANDNCKFEIKYQLLSPESVKLATAVTKHVAIDPQTRRRRELPVSLNKWLSQWNGD